MFYTNLESDKGREIAATPRVALTFHWARHERQVRIDGVAGALGRAQVEEHFASRSRASQIGAWASDQSRPLPSGEAFKSAVAEMEQKFPDGVPTPPYWGGFRVAPERMEFWQGRRSRLHERTAFTRSRGGWDCERLYP